MIGLDTNVIVRYITQDDKDQAAKASTLIENHLDLKNPGFISLIALVEVAWVLESCYEQDKKSLLEILQLILSTKQFRVENADIAYLAMKRCESNVAADFSDALITAISEREGCSRVVTFDKKARLVGMQLL